SCPVQVGCPKSLPTVGAPCKSPGETCPFDFPGTCAGHFVATCEAGGWQVSDESPPCAPACAYPDATTCAADPACQWPRPRRAAEPTWPAGCFATCGPDSVCPNGQVCTPIDVDPCWDKGCDACSMVAYACPA